MRIILGSNSKWRKQVLEKMGYEFDVLVPEIDEKVIRHSDPEILTLSLANAKADKIIKMINDDATILSFDVVAFCDGKILEKPRDEKEARLFLESYAKNPVEGISAVVAHNTKTGKRVSGLQRSSVLFKKFDDEFIDTLINEKDILSCAGAFRILDPRFDEYIVSIDGEKECFTGIPKELTKRLIKEVSE